MSESDNTSFEAMRHAMVASQLRTVAVDDAAVIEAMTHVPREAFVPEDMRALAYRDTALPIGGGRLQNSPLATGRLLTAAQIARGEKVLLIGAAGGYTAAVLARMGCSVVAVEEAADLVALARVSLAGGNVELVEGPLNAGAADHAPFDLIVIDGAVEHVPDAIVAQLRDGGRMVTGLIDRGVCRLTLGRKTSGFTLVPFADADAVVLPGFALPKIFSF